MKRYTNSRIFALLLGLLFHITLQAQRAITPFALIEKPGALSAGESDIKGPAYDTAFVIYQRLAEARGDRRFPLPAFRLSAEERQGAFLEGDGRSIGLEKKAYDICMRYGREAVAVLLGHELTHFYEKHQWRRGFLAANEDLEISRTLNINQLDTLENIQNEAQADYLGGFLAYSAGYPVFERMPDLLQDIYDEYGLNDADMPNYPSLADRQELARISVRQLRLLVDLYDMSNLLIAIGRYTDARICLRQILTQYQGREIYNNLGALTLLDALRYRPQAERNSFLLPIEVETRFGAGSKGDENNPDSLWMAMLYEAQTYLRNAVSMDRRYAPAYLNLACSYYLLGDTVRARFYAAVEAREHARHQRLKFPKTEQDIDILLALLAIHQGRQQTAKQILESYRDSTGIAQYNLAILERTPVIPAPANRALLFPESLEGLKAGDLGAFMNNPLNSRRRQELSPAPKVVLRVWELAQSKIYRYDPPASIDQRPSVVFHLANYQNNNTSENGFKRGDKYAQVKSKLGLEEPTHSMELPTGRIVLHGDLLFFLDRAGEINRWGYRG